MPTKGHAFDKWKVNDIYKDDKRKQAVVAEAAASVAASKIRSAQKEEARKRQHVFVHFLFWI